MHLNENTRRVDLKYEYLGRIEQVGIENLRGVSEFDDSEKDESREDEFIDEDHAWNFVVFSRVQNAWARNIPRFTLDMHV